MTSKFVLEFVIVCMDCGTVCGCKDNRTVKRCAHCRHDNECFIETDHKKTFGLCNQCAEIRRGNGEF